MVKVNFKLSDLDSVSLTIIESEKLKDLLERVSQKYGVELGDFIAIRGGKVITKDDLVLDNDEIDLFPAISGG